MYIVDLFKRIFHTSNITIFLYLIINVGIISAVVYYMYFPPLWQAALIGIGVYAVSLMLALSPFGEWLLRITNKCKKIQDIDTINFIEPIFIDVKEKAMTLNPSISSDVTIFINQTEEPFAFATGRKTICVSTGMLRRPESEIRAALAHEFGHLAHKDTDLILMVNVGNIIVQIILIGLRLLMLFIELILGITAAILGGEDGLIGVITTILYQILCTIILGIITSIWNGLGVVLVMRACRQTEFEADEFAYNLGYGDELCSLLNSIDFNNSKGLFASLANSHPSKEDRIARLCALSGNYSPTL